MAQLRDGVLDLVLTRGIGGRLAQQLFPVRVLIEGAHLPAHEWPAIRLPDEAAHDVEDFGFCRRNDQALIVFDPGREAPFDVGFRHRRQKDIIAWRQADGGADFLDLLVDIALAGIAQRLDFVAIEPDADGVVASDAKAGSSGVR